MVVNDENKILKTFLKYKSTSEKIVYKEYDNNKNNTESYIISKIDYKKDRNKSFTKYYLYIINSFSELEFSSRQKFFVSYSYKDKTEKVYEAKIGPLQVTIQNKGYGSALMTQFLQDTKKMALSPSGCEMIGTLDSACDKDHKERLYHFYKKFGFEIDDKSNIKLILKSY